MCACACARRILPPSPSLSLLARIQREAEVTGICKIVPPKGWKPHFAIDMDDDANVFETRLQRVHQLQVGA